MSSPQFQTFAAWLLILPIFIARVSIGGYGGDYNLYDGFGLGFLGYITNVSLILVCSFHLKDSKLSVVNVLILWAVLISVGLVQLLILEDKTGIGLTDTLPPYLRGCLWLLAVSIYLITLYDLKKLTDVFYRACRIAAIISILCFVAYLLGTPIGVHIERGYPRVHGFSSEPSALAVTMSAYLVYSIHARRIPDAILAVIAIVLAASVIVFISAFFVVVVYSLRWVQQRKASLFTIALLPLMIFISILSLDYRNTAAISEVATNILSMIEDVGDESFIVKISLIRVVDAVAMLSYSLENYSAGSSDGVVGRLIGAVKLYDKMRYENIEYFGYGLNVHGTVSLKYDQELLDYGYISYLLSSFGLIIGSVLIAILCYNVGHAASTGGQYGILFVSGVVGAALNSAHGIHIYTIPTILILMWFMGIKNPFSDDNRL